MSVLEIRYGSRVLIKDHSELEGSCGVVIKIDDAGRANVLLDKEIIWSVNLDKLELVT